MRTTSRCPEQRPLDVVQPHLDQRRFDGLLIGHGTLPLLHTARRPRA